MSKRYSNSRNSRRRTRQSLQSEISGVLDPDSDVGFDGEGDPLWFQRLDNNSVSVRPSKRFSAIQNENTLLDSNSEPDSTPLRKSWWKGLDNTPDIQLDRRVQSDAARIKSHDEGNHISDSDSSNISPVDESLIKQRSRLRRNKRKSLQKNVFSEVLESSKVSIGSEKNDRSTQRRDKQDESISSSTSDTSKSVEKIRKLPFKKRRQVAPIRGSQDLAENPEDNLSNVFENVLEASDQFDHSNSNLSIGSAETLKLKHPLPPNHETQNNSSTDVSSQVLESPQAKSPRKKRTIFTATRKRKTPNFSELLNEESEDEQLGDQPSNEEVVKSDQKQVITDISSRVSESSQAISPRTNQTISAATRKRKTANFSELLNEESEDEQLGDQPSNEEVVKSNQKKAITDISSRVSESSQAISPRNKQTISAETRKKKTANFSELLNEESEDEQLGDQPSNEEVVKSNQKKAITDISSRVSESSQAISPRNKQTISAATRKRKTANFSELLNDEGEDEQLGNQHANEELVKSNQNEEITESGTLPSRIIGSRSNIPASQRDSDSEDSIKKSRGTFLRKKRRSNQEQVFAQALESSSSSVHSETRQREKIDTLIRSRHESPKSDFERQSMTRKNDQDTPVRPSSRLPIRHSRSKSKAGPEEIDSQSRAASDGNPLDQDQVGEEQSNIRLLITSDEEEDHEDITGNENIPESSVSLVKVMPVTRSLSRVLKGRSDEEVSGNEEFQTSVSTGWEEVASSTRHDSAGVQNVGEVSKSLLKVSSDTTKKSTGLSTSNKRKSSTGRTVGVTRVAQDVTEKIISSGAYNERESTHQPDLSQRTQLSTQTDPEKAARLKGALEQVKKKFGLPQNSGIESYFIKTIKPKAAVINPEILASQKTPVRNQRKTPLVEPNKAYIVDGKVYKRPKLPRPKPWVTDRLYNFLWKQMEPKYKLKTRIRSEKFITVLSDVVSLVIRRKKYENYKKDLQDLIKEMAHLGIIKTRNDFNKFCQDFLPPNFRMKVVPMVLPGNVRNVPFHPDELHTPIL